MLGIISERNAHDTHFETGEIHGQRQPACIAVAVKVLKHTSMKGFAVVTYIRDWLEGQSLLPMLLTGLAIGIGSGAWALWGLGGWWGGVVCLGLAALAVILSWGAGKSRFRWPCLFPVPSAG